MAFNLAQFNINPFNIAGGNVKWIKATGNEYISASVGSALQIFIQAYGNERVSEDVVGVPARFIVASGRESIAEGVTRAQPTILLYPNYRENVTAETDISAVITPNAVLSEVIEPDIILAADAYLSAIGSEEITEEVEIAADTYLSAEGFELISESASLEVIDTKTCILTTTLKPGERIVIDADSYTVLLNGENAIEIQSGDWIDELDRNTTDISLKAAAGVSYLSAHIIYTERYL